MKHQIKTNIDIQTKTQCLVIGLLQQNDLSAQYSDINAATAESIDTLQNNKVFKGVHGEIAHIALPTGINAQNLVYVGLGKASKLTTENYRQLCNKLALKLKNLSITSADIDFSLAISDELKANTMARHLVEAFSDQEYVYEKQPKADKPNKQKEFKTIIYTNGTEQQKQAKQGAAIGHAIGDGKTVARNLGNMPGNVCTPSFLAEHAQNLGKSHKLDVTILEESDMEKLGMGSLLSVSKGSREPAKFIVMEYKGAKNKDEAPHALVGKGLTFDAGGISLKPSGKMDEMKYDMCGAASVFGAIQAAAELKLAINIVGVIPSSENLPDGIANKPGDVVTSMAGKTIEILNTDAEGRLILCDALTYTERFKPKSVIDIATLTGAVIVALGHQTAGLMGNNQQVIDDVLNAGETSLDHAWQLPIKETYKAQLKSDYADLANIGGPSAGSITAACFLSCFTEKFRWAHLDIAGTAWGGAGGKRASGRAVPILTQYLIDRAG